jgi:hypothetical protein
MALFLRLTKVTKFLSKRALPVSVKYKYYLTGRNQLQKNINPLLPEKAEVDTSVIPVLKK